MSTFERDSSGALHFSGVALADLAAAYGTPLYVYSADHFSQQFEKLSRAFDGLRYHLFYAVKANSNLAVLRHFAELGAGFDIVSGGELTRVLAAVGSAENVVFSGVGKRGDELDFALKANIRCFNIESEPELGRLAQHAERLGVTANVALRVNPDVDAKTHPYISTGLKENKFGVPIERALDIYRRAQDLAHINIEGVDCHIGSQLLEREPLLESFEALLQLREQLSAAGIELNTLNLGGGMGITYQAEQEFDVAAYGAALRQRLEDSAVTLHFEPGRFLVANGGVLLTRVEYLKPAASADAGRNFAVVDAAMNDLIRPALYGAWHDVLAVAQHGLAQEAQWDVVGPVCESGDFLAKDRTLALAQDDLLAVSSAGAYGFVQASNYNTRPRPAEVMIENGEPRLVRRRESVSDLLRLEQELP